MPEYQNNIAFMNNVPDPRTNGGGGGKESGEKEKKKNKSRKNECLVIIISPSCMHAYLQRYNQS